MYVNKSLQANEIYSLMLNVGDTEDVWIEIGNRKNNNSIIVSFIYRHPRQTIFNFECAFANSIKFFNAKQNYLIFGDFNIDYMGSNSTTSVSNDVNHTSDLGCAQLIDKPNRICNTTSTIIDHVHTNVTFTSDIPAAVLCHDISDHLPTFVELKTANITKKSTSQLFRNFSSDGIELFLTELRSELAYNHESKESNLISLIEVLTKLTNKHFPLTAPTRKQFRVIKKPWIIKGLLVSIKHKNKLYGQSIKKKCPLLLAKEASKRRYYSNLINTSNSSTSTWK